MYAKVFAQIFDSSIADDFQLRHFFMDLLVLADPDGVVDMTPAAIAARTRIPLQDVVAMLSKLEMPDPESRTPDAGGRRIERLDGHRTWGWHIINYSRFRQIASEEQRREKTRQRVARFKQKRQRNTTANAPVTPANAGNAMQKKNQRQRQITTSEVNSGELQLQAEDIYRSYPLKVGKPAAIRAILNALKKFPASLLVAKTKEFTAVRAGDKEYMPHPATWFNQERFNDDPATWVRNGTSTHKTNERREGITCPVVVYGGPNGTNTD